ncbi:MAG: type IV secretory system conjugative DNA transfer family protein, partial [Acidimicrobiales bacterium]
LPHGVRAGWSPVAAAGTWEGARRVAAALCSIGGRGGMEDAGFWHASAERLLAPMLRAAAVTGGGMADVVRWLDEESAGEILLALELAGASLAVRAARACFGLDDRQRSSVFSTAATIVAAYADPSIAASEYVMPRITADWLLGGGPLPRTLYCSAPARDQERLSPVFVAMVREVLDAAFETSARTGAPLDPPLLVVLDEAANIAPLADLDRILATAAGHGISLVTIWQDLAQAEARFGGRWATVVNNHRAKLVCPGVSDPRTLELVSALVGDAERQERTRTTSRDGAWSETEATGRTVIAPAGWIRRLPAGHGLLVYGTLPPALVRLRRVVASSGP